MGGLYLNLIKATHDKTMANHIQLGKDKRFPLKSVAGQWCPLSPPVQYMAFEILARTIRSEKEI